MDQSQPPPIKPRPQSKSEQLPTAAGQGQSRRMPTEEADDNLYDVIADDISPTTSSSGVMYFTREAALKSNSVLPMRKQRTRRSAAQWVSLLMSSLRLYFGVMLWYRPILIIESQSTAKLSI
jgi:hypothetical protein